MEDFALFKMSKCTNHDTKDAACLHIVHNLQHPTSRPTTKSTQPTMVYPPGEDFSPLPVGKDGQYTMWCTQKRHQVNDGKSGLDVERLRVLGSVCSLRCNKNLAMEKQCKTHFSSNHEKEKLIEDYDDRETADA